MRSLLSEKYHTLKFSLVKLFFGVKGTGGVGGEEDESGVSAFSRD